MAISIDDDLVLSSGLPRPYACISARWTTHDTLRAIWGACSMGRRPQQYVQNAFIFQNDTKSFVVTVALPESGDSLADASEIVYRVFNPRNADATVFNYTLTGGGITILTATTFQFTIDNADNDVAAGWYRHECQITDAGDEPSTVLTGRFEVVDTIIGDA